MVRYLYWLKNTQNGAGIGSWSNKGDAIKAANLWGKQMDTDYEIVCHKAVPCPLCGRPTEEDTRESFGMCLRCDHVRGDIY